MRLRGLWRKEIHVKASRSGMLRPKTNWIENVSRPQRDFTDWRTTWVKERRTTFKSFLYPLSASWWLPNGGSFKWKSGYQKPKNVVKRLKRLIIFERYAVTQLFRGAQSVLGYSYTGCGLCFYRNTYEPGYLGQQSDPPQAEQSWVRFPEWKFCSSRHPDRLTHSPVRWVPGTSRLAELGRSPPSIVEIKNLFRFTSVCLTLLKHSENFNS